VERSVVLINIWAFSCLYMGHFVPALNGPCSCPPMGRDLDPNPARYNGPCRPGTKLFRAVPCLGRAFFSVLRAGPPGPAQMYTYRGSTAETALGLAVHPHPMQKVKGRTKRSPSRRQPTSLLLQAVTTGIYSFQPEQRLPASDGFGCLWLWTYLTSSCQEWTPTLAAG
jgi:hypothetical protein